MLCCQGCNVFLRHDWGLVRSPLHLQNDLTATLSHSDPHKPQAHAEQRQQTAPQGDLQRNQKNACSVNGATGDRADRYKQRETEADEKDMVASTHDYNDAGCCGVATICVS